MDPPEAKKNGTPLVFSIKQQPLAGALSSALRHFEDLGVKISHVESRPSKTQAEKEKENAWDIFVDCADCSEEKIDNLVYKLIGEHHIMTVRKKEIPWFPSHIRDLDLTAAKVLEAGADLEAKHPGFNDPVYRRRRQYFADIANKYKHGEPIPHVNYTKQETETWGTIFRELTKLYPTNACKEHNEIFPLLIKNCGYSEDNIPQLEDVSKFLKGCTDFQLRPVAGLLTPRDFLAGLAFRVFHSTQYIRHSSKPEYTPEPDVCHELLGHAPLFCNPSFAQFSQEIGLASLGAPDDYIEKLSTLYWFTIEFGLCKQDGQRKAYGAGLLSSFGELQYCLSDGSCAEDIKPPEVKPFVPSETAVQEVPITKYQPVYFLADSFQDATKKLVEWSKTIPRPFGVHYDSSTDSVQVMNSN